MKERILNQLIRTSLHCTEAIDKLEPVLTVVGTGAAGKVLKDCILKCEDAIDALDNAEDVIRRDYEAT